MRTADMQQKRGYAAHARSHPRQIPFRWDLTYIVLVPTPPCVCRQLSHAHINLAQYLHTSGCTDTWLTSNCHPRCRFQTVPVACLITEGEESREHATNPVIPEQWSCMWIQHSVNHVSQWRYREAWLNPVITSGTCFKKEGKKKKRWRHGGDAEVLRTSLI